MKAQLFSDLHLDVTPMEPPVGGDADLCLIAGDLHEVDQGIAFIEEMLKARDVVYLPGNHEAYTASLARVRALFRQHAKRLPGFTFLDRSTVVYEDVRFIGATLWVDFDRQNPLAMIQGQGLIKDYQYIAHDTENRLILPADILQEHQRDLAFIEAELARPWQGKTVLMTHMAPSHRSCTGKYAGAYSNFLYASDLERLFHQYPINYWAHGHIHDAVDYQLGDARLISNPRGTSARAAAQFDPYFTFEI